MIMHLKSPSSTMPCSQDTATSGRVRISATHLKAVAAKHAKIKGGHIMCSTTKNRCCSCSIASCAVVLNLSWRREGLLIHVVSSVVCMCPVAFMEQICSKY